MKGDYILTFLTQFAVLGSGLLVYKLAADFLGKDGFSEYAMSKRTVSFILPGLSMGLGIGIPRYIACAHADPNCKNPDDYFVSAVLMLSLAVLMFTSLFNLFDGIFSYLFFGSSLYTYLIFPITLMIVGNVFHSTLYSYFRGRLMMVKANSLQILNMGVVPPLTFYFFGSTLPSLLLATGIIWIVVSTAFLIFIQLTMEIKKGRNVIRSAREIMSYSIARVPGDLAMSALLALPAFLAAHVTTIREAGFVAFGITVLNLVGYSFAPISTILLPKASQMIALGDLAKLRRDVTRMLLGVVTVTLLGVIALELFTSRLIAIYLKETFTETTKILKIIGIGIGPYVLYILLRSIVDAYYVKPINAINILVSLIIFLTGASLILFFEWNYIYIVWSFAVSTSALGLLSLLVVRNIFNKESNCPSF